MTISNLLGDIPDSGIPDIGAPDVPGLFISGDTADILDSSRKGWHSQSKPEPRCDFFPSRCRLRVAKPVFVHTRWQRSKKGRTLPQIKSDPDMVGFFAQNIAHFISEVIGNNLSVGGWAVATPPPRRHLEENFAQAFAAKIADILGIPFRPHVLKAINRQRVQATFEAVELPPEHNLVMVDDIVTTGSTFNAVHRALAHLGFNITYFAGINNNE